MPDRPTAAERPPRATRRPDRCLDLTGADEATRRRVAERLICEAAARYVHPYLRDSALAAREAADDDATTEGQRGR